MKKLISILVALAMMMTLAVTAFAETENSTGTKVEKVLTMPKGVAPTGKITIKTHLDTIDGVEPASTDTTGVIDDQEINLASGWVKKDDTGAAQDIYYYETSDVLLADDYHGGVYKYTITEDVANWTVPEGATKTPDNTQYEMTVNVASDGTVKQVYVGTDQNKKDLYEDITEENAEAVASNGTVFKNSVEQDATADNYENSKLKAWKVVEADTNGVSDQTTGFKFHVTLTLPDIGTADQATYVIYDASEDTTSAPVSVSTDAEGFDVELAHNDKLYFTNVPVGTQATIIETDARVGTGDAQTYTKKADSTEIEDQTVTADTALEAKVTNVHKATDPTGILMSNLPYIILALVAIGGMVAYVVMRRKAGSEA